MNTDNLNFIIDKIAKNQQTESDVSTLKEALTIANNSQIVEQLGKYNVNIVDGKDISIGDHIFQQWDDEAIHRLVCIIRFGESIEPKIREKQKYYRNEIQKIENQGKEKLYQLKTKRQEELKETKCLLLQLAGMEIRNNSKNDKRSKKIAEKHIKILDKLQIQIIDMLWNVYSNDKFSFKKQINIFKNANQEYNSFAETIGWKKQSLFIFNFLSWKSDDEILFNTDAPEGHLPFWNHYIVNPRQFIMYLIELQL